MGNKIDDIAKTQEFLSDSRWCSVLERFDADVDKVTRALKAILATADFDVVPDQFSSELIRSGMLLKDADENFRKVCIAVTNGKCGSKEFKASFMAFVNKLQSLQEIVAFCERVVKAKPMIVLGFILIGAKLVASSQIKNLAILRGKLEDLIVSLKKANQIADKAKWAALLNAALSTATLMIVPEAKLMKVCTALSAIFGHITIDNFLGPKGVTIDSSGRTLIGDAPDVIEGVLEELSKYLEKIESALESAGKSIAAAAKPLGIGAAVATLKVDSDEIEEAENAVAEAKEALEAARKRVDFAESTMSPLVAQVQQIDEGLRRLSKAVQEAIAGSGNAAMNYSASIAMIKKL